MKKLVGYSNILLFYLVFLSGCATNQVLSYLNDVEIQYEGETQMNTIKNALNDALTLSVTELKKKRYKDYRGNKAAWDLQRVLYSHLISDKKTLGENFYQDLKDPQVQKRIRDILGEKSLNLAL